MLVLTFIQLRKLAVVALHTCICCQFDYYNMMLNVNYFCIFFQTFLGNAFFLNCWLHFIVLALF